MLSTKKIRAYWQPDSISWNDEVPATLIESVHSSQRLLVARPFWARLYTTKSAGHHRNCALYIIEDVREWINRRQRDIEVLLRYQSIQTVLKWMDFCRYYRTVDCFAFNCLRKDFYVSCNIWKCYSYDSSLDQRGVICLQLQYANDWNESTFWVISPSFRTATSGSGGWI